MHGFTAFQKPAPGGFVLFEQLEPAAFLRTEPVVRVVVQQRSGRADDGIEANEFLGFFHRQPNQNPVTERVDRVAVIIITGHAGQLNGAVKFVNAVPDLT